MSEKADDDRLGTYVDTPPYLEMRLRMLLTEQSGPSDETWVSALQVLLHELEHTSGGQAILHQIKIRTTK